MTSDDGVCAPGPTKRAVLVSGDRQAPTSDYVKSTGNGKRETVRVTQARSRQWIEREPRCSGRTGDEGCGRCKREFQVVPDRGSDEVPRKLARGTYLRYTWASLEA